MNSLTRADLIPSLRKFDNMENRSAIRQPNCLNTVRLLAALLVLLGHAHLHLDIILPAWSIWLVGFFRGVPVFFVLSGFLVWHSAGRSGWKEYAKKRFLRIYPELWCAVLLGLLAILTLFRGSISWGGLGVFTLTQGSFLQFWTPDFLRGYGCGTPNGALWTICTTVQFYVVCPLVYRWLHGKKPWLWLTGLGAMIAANVLSPLLSRVLPTILYKLVMQTLLPYGWLFFLGCFLSEFSERLLPWLKKLWPLLLILAAGILWFGWDIGTYYGTVHSILMTAGMIGFAYAVPRLNIKLDISYGIYIYHMVVINAMITHGFTGSHGHLLIVLAVTGTLALVSRLTVGAIGIRKKTKKAGERL